MHSSAIIVVSNAVAACSIGVPSVAAAQQKSVKDQLVGTWRLLLDDGIKADGSEVPRFGSNPLGMLIFAADRHYSLQVMRVDGRPAALSAGPAAGVLTHFGTYTIDSETLYFYIQASSNPTLAGSHKGRPITASRTSS
jgi:Lipocalin-like domain